MNIDNILHIASFIEEEEDIMNISNLITNEEIIEKMKDILPSYNVKRVLFRLLLKMYQVLSTPEYEMFLYMKDILCLEYYSISVRDENHIDISISEPRYHFEKIQEKYPNIQIDDVYLYIIVPVDDPHKFVNTTYKIGELYGINTLIDIYNHCILQLSNIKN